MSAWETILSHASALSLGSDALMIVSAVSSGNGGLFATAFTAFMTDLAREAKIKEITPEMMAQLQPHIEGMASVLMAKANN